MQTEKFIPLIKAVIIFTRDYNTKGQADIPEVLLTAVVASLSAVPEDLLTSELEALSEADRSVTQLLRRLLRCGTGTSAAMLPCLSSSLLEVLNTTLGPRKGNSL